MFASIEVAQSLQKALNGLLGFIPNLLGFLVILVVGFVIARAVKGVVTKLLQKAKLDHALHSGESGRYVERLSPNASPSALVGGAAAKLTGDTPTATFVGTAIPALVMGIAVFMVLNQLKIAPAIVQSTDIALLGSIALGTALAFGLGGRDVAGRLLSQACEKGQQNRDEVKQDMQIGKERGHEHAAQAKDKARQGMDGPANDAYVR